MLDYIGPIRSFLATFILSHINVFLEMFKVIKKYGYFYGGFWIFTLFIQEIGFNDALICCKMRVFKN